jgi:hypothetical protein
MKERFLIDEAKNRIELLDTRFYKDDVTGDFFPSATTILDAYPKSYAFYEWLKSVGDKADEIRDSFGQRGSTVHNLTEIYDMGAEVNLMSENGRAQFSSIEWAMFERYVHFSNRETPEIICIEAHYCSSMLGFGGTLDRIIKKDDKFILIDIKTSNYLHNHFWLQMAAYVKLWEEKNPQYPIDQIAVLWLNAKTRTDKSDWAKKEVQGVGWQLKFPEKDIEYYWNLFKATKTLWMEENAGMKPKNISYQLTHVKE